MAKIRLVLVMLLAVVSVGLDAREPAQEQTYLITLRPDVDNASGFARELTRLYGAAIEGDVDPNAGAVMARLTAARARVVAADPRVAAVQSAAALQQDQSAAEVVSWSSGVTYTYDSSGNVWKAGADTFRYDHANRLIYANVNGVPRHYTYDAFGNRTGCRQSPGTSMAADCQLAKTIDSTENRNRIEEASYDDAGNVKMLDGHQYSYDALNMMTQDKFGALVREFVYTPDDERIAVAAGSSWDWTIRDEKGTPLRKFSSGHGAGGPGTGSWAWTKDYVWRNGLLLASRQPETADITTYHYHLDHLGTPRRITDQKDKIVGSHDYFAFGPDISGGTNESSFTTLKYTGHERDSWGGIYGTLDYMHARYYHPELGRFLSVDPAVERDLTDPQGWNLYVYSRNNPLSFFDPDGFKARLYTYIGFTNPGPKSELPTANAIRSELRTELGSRIVNHRLQMNPKASPQAFRSGMTDSEGITMFIGHAFTPGPGLMFDKAHSDWLQNVTNNNSLILLGGCDTAGYAKLFGIDASTTGKAFVGFAGDVNSMVLAEMTTMIVKQMEKGKSVGDAVNAVRKELARRGVKPSDFRVVLVGDPNVKVTEEEFKTSAPPK